MADDRGAQLQEQLRIAEKMIDAIYQLCSINSEVSKQSVLAKAHRAKIAVQVARKLADDVGNNVE